MLVCLAVFKTVCRGLVASRVGSIPTYSRHYTFCSLFTCMHGDVGTGAVITEVGIMNKNELLRRLPKIDEILKEESLVVLSAEKGSLLVTEAVRQVISNMRRSILDLEDGDMEYIGTDE